MSEAVLYFVKFGLLFGLCAFLFLVLRTLARDLPTPAQLAGAGPADSPEAPASIQAVYWLSRVDGDGREGPVPVADPITLGRSPHCGVRLRDPLCSARHARVEPVDGGVELRDLGSTNGTFVGSEQITEAVRLSPGDRFSVGDAVFEVKKKS